MHEQTILPLSSWLNIGCRCSTYHHAICCIHQFLWIGFKALIIC